MLNVDFVQRVKVTGLFFLQFYKIVTGTMLTLFIPQNCNKQICSINDNLEKDERYHRIALSWNTLTMMSFFVLYIFELKRENWSIKYLDIDNDKPDNALKEIIVKEKKLDMIVANDVSSKDSGFSVDNNRVVILDKKGSKTDLPLLSKLQVADHIMDRLSELL